MSITTAVLCSVNTLLCLWSVIAVDVELQIQHIYSKNCLDVGWCTCMFQKQEEAQSNSLVSTADVDNETIITLVTEAVTSILNRLHSKNYPSSDSSCIYTYI